MWNPIYELAKTTALLLTISADAKANQLVVTVTPRPSGKGEPALSQPLTLRGTPEELDSGFVDALTRYGTSYASLKETVEASLALMEEAKKTAAAKATPAAKPAAAKPGASTKPPVSAPAAKAATATPAVQSVPEAGDKGDDDEAESAPADNAATEAATATAPDIKTLNLFA